MVAAGVNPFTDIICSRWSLADGSTEDLHKVKSFRIIDDDQISGQLNSDGIRFGAACYLVPYKPFRSGRRPIWLPLRWSVLPDRSRCTNEGNIFLFNLRHPTENRRSVKCFY
uniref:(northern house mosquito) hypothetical protein n=1 Tax=Culex pipiens TaxID=7175 RepID=A0A8D8K6H5_CULPI